jgi:VanZ family protein
VDRSEALNVDRKRFHFAITAAVMIYIFIQSALPGDVSGAESSIIVRMITSIVQADPETVSFIVRKAAHFTEYMVLGACLLLNVRDCFAHLHPRQMWGLAWLLGTAYAVTDELHQRFVPERSCEPRDMCIDAAGVALGALIMLAIVMWQRAGRKEDA